VATATKAVLRPLDDRIVVEPADAERTTTSGLLIPDTAADKPHEGTVLAVGPGRWNDRGTTRIPLDIKVADAVVYNKYGGAEVTYNNEDYLVLSTRDILAIIEK
jgi:chaperonin GroES